MKKQLTIIKIVFKNELPSETALFPFSRLNNTASSGISEGKFNDTKSGTKLPLHR